MPLPKGYVPTLAHRINISLAKTEISTITEKQREILRNAQLGRKHSKETIEKRVSQFRGIDSVKWKGGIPNCKKCGKKLGSRNTKTELCIKCWGEEHTREKASQWKGGITPINQYIRGSVEYKKWEREVIKNDSFKCNKCGEVRKKKYLVAHHIQNFSSYPELRFIVSNGITFCKDCHKLFHKIYGKKNNNLNQVIEFISNENHTLHNNRFISGFTANPSQGRGE